MNYPDRVKHIERLEQTVSFKGMNYGTSTPTDIDAVIELKDRLLVLIELKHQTGVFPDGQRWTLERIVNNSTTKDRHAYCILARHYQEDVSQPVICKDAIVDKIYQNKKWVKPTREITVGEAVDIMIKKANINL